MLGSVAGPDPYPAMVNVFQSVIGQEVKEQMLKAEEPARLSCSLCRRSVVMP